MLPRPPLPERIRGPPRGLQPTEAHLTLPSMLAARDDAQQEQPADMRLQKLLQQIDEWTKVTEVLQKKQQKLQHQLGNITGCQDPPPAPDDELVFPPLNRDLGSIGDSV